jgi:hypothetical protein
VPDLTLLDQVLHCAGDIFDLHVGINPVLIEQVDDFDPKPLERAFDCLVDMFRSAVQARCSFDPAGIEIRI